jgi:NodT family efflux transporter outer membrane factor (OMF) lipoprotein
MQSLLPQQFSVADTNSTAHGDPWWQDFGNSDINTVVNNALAGNLSIAQAEARLRQAAARARKAGAALVPELSLAGGAGVSRQHSDSSPTSESAATTDTESYSLGLSAASYEVDLWGRVRAARNAARETWQASAQDLATARITLSADITDAWLQLLELQNRRALIASQLETSRKLIDLLQVRRRLSQSSALDVYQQEQSAAAISALVPQVDIQLTVLTNQLNILQGRAIDTPLPQSITNLPTLPPLPSVGLPADLLTNRPDILAAQRRLESAGWNLAAARADRLPALRLTGKAAYQSDQFSSLFDNWILNIASSLTAPLIDGGRRRAEVDLQQAALDEQLAAYKATVLNAVAEVENALQREQQQQRLLEALQRQRDFAYSALLEARNRYRKGSIDYLNVLTALTSVQTLDRQLITAQRQLLSYRVGLCRALGTSWNADLQNSRLTANNEDNHEQK